MSIFFCLLAGQLEVKIKKVSVARSNSAVKAGMSCYPMTSKPRGLALIIEINEYENDVHEPRIGSQVFFQKNGPSLASFSFIFGLFKQTIQILQQNNVKKCPSSIRCRDSNSQSSDYESPNLTTRPGLPPNPINTCYIILYVILLLSLWEERVQISVKLTNKYLMKFTYLVPIFLLLLGLQHTHRYWMDIFHIYLL